MIGKEKKSVEHECVIKEQKKAFVIASHTTCPTKESYACMNENLFSPYKRYNEYIQMI
jgi:hypothetical protein